MSVATIIFLSIAALLGFGAFVLFVSGDGTRPFDRNWPEVARRHNAWIFWLALFAIIFATAGGIVAL